MAKLTKNPSIVLDHHGVVQNQIDFATVTINDDHYSSTGELIYDLAQKIEWPLSITAQECLMSAILGDTQGLSNSLTKPSTYRLIADMIENGVDRSAIEDARRDQGKMETVIYRYKGDLIQRTEFLLNGKLAIVIIPQEEINNFSPLYNPAPLIQSDMLQTRGVGVAVVIKEYDDGHVTAAIRCNNGFPVADKLAEHFGGGGHLYASGFKIRIGKSGQETKTECAAVLDELLREK